MVIQSDKTREYCDWNTDLFSTLKRHTIHESETKEQFDQPKDRLEDEYIFSTRDGSGGH
jgi:hypothetical protein